MFGCALLNWVFMYGYILSNLMVAGSTDVSKGAAGPAGLFRVVDTFIAEKKRNFSLTTFNRIFLF